MVPPAADKKQRSAVLVPASSLPKKVRIESRGNLLFILALLTYVGLQSLPEGTARRGKLEQIKFV